MTLVVLAYVSSVTFTAIRNSESGTPGVESSANARADAEGRIVISEQQAPHSARLRRRLTPRRALRDAIANDMRRRVARHELNGPVQGARCRATSARRARTAFACSVRAGDVSYPFLGVVDIARGRVTWCKRDPAPDPALDVAVSRRCRSQERASHRGSRP